MNSNGTSHGLAKANYSRRGNLLLLLSLLTTIVSFIVVTTFGLSYRLNIRVHVLTRQTLGWTT